MSDKQMDTWNQLFGNETEAEVVCRIINKFFVHPDTQIELRCRKKTASVSSRFFMYAIPPYMEEFVFADIGCTHIQ